MEEKEIKAPAEMNAESSPQTLGDDILKLLGERTQNPGDAFILLQQLAIFVWDQYKVDWSSGEGVEVASSRKQRLMDYISHLIDAFKSDEPAS